MRLFFHALLFGSCALAAARADLAGPKAAPPDPAYGPAAALTFARHYRGDAYTPGVNCYPGAVGVPLGDCRNLIPMGARLWTPKQISGDFRMRMKEELPAARKKGIIVVLKTERCATKWLRACTVTTAALEKRSTPLVSEFLVYAVLLQPRDGDDPPGSRQIETGADAWKNDAAAAYSFKQGPGATLAFLDPDDGSLIEGSDAVSLGLYEEEFEKNGGQTPALRAMLAQVLVRLKRRSATHGS